VNGVDRGTRFRIEPLDRKRHDWAAFVCGVEAIDRYLKTQATQDMRRKANAVLVMVPLDAGWNDVGSWAALHDVLISLAPEVPTWFSRFTRIAELVGAAEDDKVRGRERFRFYRERGYPLETHNL
jgi:DNA polymerase IIIc chi subunit